MKAFAAHFSRCPLIAILRGVKPAEAAAIGAALVEAGITLIEVPLNSPDPFDSIAALRGALADSALVGAGTVLNLQDLRGVIAASGEMIVSPNFNADVVRATAAAGLVSLPGVVTPSEAFAALDCGAHGLKLFPGEMVTPAAVKAIRAVLPAKTILIPVGGVSRDSIPLYLAAGASGFGIGSALFKPGDDAKTVGERARGFAAMLNS